MRTFEKMHLLSELKKAGRISEEDYDRQRAKIGGASTQQLGSYMLLGAFEEGRALGRHVNKSFFAAQGEVQIRKCVHDEPEVFAREAALRFQHPHPHVLPIYELIVQGDVLAMVEPIPSAKDVEQYRNEVEREQKIRILGQLADLFDDLVSKDIPLGWVPIELVRIKDHSIQLLSFGMEMQHTTHMPAQLRWLFSEAEKKKIPPYLVSWSLIAIDLLELKANAGRSDTPFALQLISSPTGGDVSLQSCADLLSVLSENLPAPASLNTKPGVLYEGLESDVFRLSIRGVESRWSRIARKESSFFMMQTPVVQDLYILLDLENDSLFRDGQRPVDTVNLFDALRFCNLLSEMLGLEEYYWISSRWIKINPKSNGVRLPSPSEWLEAARAGQPFVFAGAVNPKECAWFEDNANNRTQPVAQLCPNAHELYDMSGNVWEWTFVEDKARNEEQAALGGSWQESYSGITLGEKIVLSPEAKRPDLGFRPIIPAIWPKKE